MCLCFKRDCFVWGEKFPQPHLPFARGGGRRQGRQDEEDTQKWHFRDDSSPGCGGFSPLHLCVPD